MVPQIDAKTKSHLLGMRPGTEIWIVLKDSPAAEAGLLPGDVVLSIGDYRRYPTWEQFRQATNTGGEPVEVTVLRKGEQKQFTITPRRAGWFTRTTVIGVLPWVSDRHPVVAEVLENSAAAMAGIPAGAVLTQINAQPLSGNWGQMLELIEQGQGKDIRIDYTLDGVVGQAVIPAAATADRKHMLMRPDFGLALLQPKQVPLRAGPLMAIWLGAERTYRFIIRTYQTLVSMARRDVSPKNLTGPVGIVNIGTEVARQDVVMLLYFLALISVNLAVINFLPLPIVDGGLMVFLLVEKLKGSPVSLRTQGIAQVIGLVLIAGVFLFVTYNDLARIFGQ